MVERFYTYLVFHLHFLIHIFPAILQHALLSMQFSYYAGNIAAGALIQTNTVHLFSFILREILKGKGLFHAVLRIHDILGWIRIRIRGSMSLANGSGSGSGSCIRILDPDPTIFAIDLQDASKKLIF
jgi:hypothetical protein